MLEHTQRTHLYLIDTRLKGRYGIHLKLGLSSQIAGAFDSKVTHFNVNIFTPLIFILDIEGQAVICDSFFVKIKVSSFKVENAPLAVFLHLSINCDFNIMQRVLNCFVFVDCFLFFDFPLFYL